MRRGTFWVVLWVGLLELVGILALFVANQSGQPSAIRSFLGYASVYILVGLVILRYHPGNRIGLILAGIGILFLANLLTAEYESYVQLTQSASPLLLNIAQHLSNLWLLPYSLIIFLLLIFPTGHLISGRWNWLAWLAFVIVLVNILSVFFSASASALANFLANIGLILLFIGLPLSVTPLVLRYRRSQDVERQQIKWFVFSGGVVTISVVGLNFLTEIIALPLVLIDSLMAVLLSCIPLAIAFAVFKYHLWDIDLVIRKTLVYGVLSIALGLIFFGGVTLLQQLFGSLSGTENSPVAIVLSTLAIAALFNPLRRLLQDFIDRRFYRKKYNAEQALARFAAVARDETDIEQLSAGLLGVVQETMQPQSVSLWLKPNRRKR